MEQASPQHALDVALAVYLERLVTGRSMLWVGVAGPWTDRLGRVARRLDVRPHLPTASEDEPFDVVVWASGFEPIDDDRTLDRLQRALGDSGVMVVAVDPADAQGYARLFERVEARLGRARVLVQAPFEGVALVDVESGGAGEVVVDDSEGEEVAPERVLVVAARGTWPKLEGYAVVRTGVDVVRASVERWRERLEAIEAELDRRTAELATVQRAASGLAMERDRLVGDRDAAMGEIERLRERLRTAERELDALHARLEQAVKTGAQDEAELERLGAELERLERALRDRSAQARGLEAELRRRDALVREMADELARVGARESDDRLEQAVGRLVLAEAALAAARFENDALRARVGARDDGLEAARLHGELRGLRARQAELAEAYETAAARAMLLEHELAATRQRLREVERHAEEAREELGLEVARARLLATEAERALRDERARWMQQQRTAAQDAGRLAGQLAACREAYAECRAERDYARAEALRLTALVSTLEQQQAGARAGWERRTAELLEEQRALQNECVRLSRKAAALRGECDGLIARLEDREAALGALAGAYRAAHAAGLEVRKERDRARDEADGLRAALEAARRREAELLEASTEAERKLAMASARAADLAQALAARDALVARLQFDLADEERRAREAVEQAERLRLEQDRLREALLEASRAVDEAAASRARLEALERERALAETREARRQAQLERVEATLGDVARLLDAWEAELGPEPSAHGTAVGLEAPGETEGEQPGRALERAERERLLAEVDRLQRRVVELERQAEGHDVLVRSLAAQIEERDERLRAIERREAVRPDGAELERLREALARAEQRAARLSDELAAERRARLDLEAAQGAITNQEQLALLSARLGERDAELLSARSRAEAADRELRLLREVCGRARVLVEELLAHATARGDLTAGDRLGELIRLLARVG
ncbi:MAG: hypothetical protein NZ898_09635 [Myxococcota bacterium]|nr:hypothetical protein [Myxococcota bacterium]